MSTAVNPRSIEQAIQPRSGPVRRGPKVDLWIILAVVGLITISLVTIASATRDDVAGNPGYYLTRQGIYFLLGTVVAVLIARFDYGRLEGMRRAFWALLIAANIFVLLFAADTRGSSRWISLPFFQLQPSELGKVLLVLALAGFAVEYARSIATLAVTARLCAIALIPACIVMLQPDLGTSLVYVAILGAVLLTAGTPTRHLVALIALGVATAVMVLAVLPSAGINVLHDYQLQRLTGFVNPSSDPSKATYQVNQSLIAIGSGQRLGRGEAGSTQTGLDFLPEHHTDFIFAVIGERWGFTGAALVIALYALLVWRALRLVVVARDGFGAILACGIAAILAFQIFVNIGMTLGIMPITGVPLPLMSYGGSSVIVTFICLGLLQSVHLRAADPAAAAVRTRVRV
ncbi:MAG: rod shape-determining protein RodA [Actinomycetes bacterium]